MRRNLSDNLITRLAIRGQLGLTSFALGSRVHDRPILKIGMKAFGQALGQIAARWLQRHHHIKRAEHLAHLFHLFKAARAMA